MANGFELGDKVMKLLAALVLIFAGFPAHAAKESKVEPTWFGKAPCTKMKIQRFEAGVTKPTHSLETVDLAGIANVREKIENISAEGDMMKSLVPKEILRLEFVCGSESRTIEIFDGAFKTPTTAFNSDAQVRKIERQVSSALRTTLIPELKALAFKLAGIEYKFPDFSITFKGTTKFDHAPATISGEIDHFEVRSAESGIQKLEISSGQLPPQPETFSVGKAKFVLRTFESKERDRLYSTYFQIHR